MTEIVPDAGLDYLLNVIFRGTAAPATTYVGLFVGGSATTVPTNAATLAAMTGTFAESASTWGYARQAITSNTTNWSAPAAATIWSQTGRGTTGSQVSFPAATAAYATPINGFFLCNVASGTSGVPLLFSNWSDETAIASLALGDQIKVTPTFGLAP